MSQPRDQLRAICSMVLPSFRKSRRDNTILPRRPERGPFKAPGTAPTRPHPPQTREPADAADYPEGLYNASPAFDKEPG